MNTFFFRLIILQNKVSGTINSKKKKNDSINHNKCGKLNKTTIKHTKAIPTTTRMDGTLYLL